MEENEQPKIVAEFDVIHKVDGDARVGVTTKARVVASGKIVSIEFLHSTDAMGQAVWLPWHDYESISEILLGMAKHIALVQGLLAR